MRITLGPSRGVAVGALYDIDFPTFCSWLRDHPRGLSPVAADYDALAAAPSASPEGERLANAKDGPWVALAEFAGNYRHLSSTPRGCAIPLDLDYAGLGASDVAQRLSGFSWCAYTTFGHRASAPRLRVIV